MDDISFKNQCENFINSLSLNKKDDPPTIKSALEMIGSATSIQPEDVSLLHTIKDKLKLIESSNPNIKVLAHRIASIEQHFKFPSLLSAPIEENLTEKDMFQIFADPFGKNSPLEGGHPDKMLTHLIAYLNNREAGGTPVCPQSQEIIKELQQALTIVENKYSADDTKVAIEQCIQQGSSTLLPGGWKGYNSGHAMLYELSFDKETNEGTLRVFNTGSGSQNHENKNVGYKIKVSPIEWTPIDPEKLTSPAFLKALEDLKSGGSSPISEDIYHGLKTVLGSFPKFPETWEESQEATPSIKLTESIDYVQQQRAGTCSFYSILAFLRTKMNLNEYRKFKCDLRIQTLVDYIFHGESIKKLSIGPLEGEAVNPETLAHYNLLDASVDEMALRVNRLFQKGVLNEADVVTYYKVLAPVKENLSEIKSKVYQKPEAGLDSTYLPWDPVESGHMSPSIISSLSNIDHKPEICLSVHSTALEQINTMTFSADHPMTAPQLQEIHDTLTQVFDDKKFGVVVHGAVSLIGKLPLAPEFWIGIDPVDGILKLKQLAALILIGRKRGEHPLEVIPEELAAMNKIMTIQVLLLRQKHPFFNDKYLVPLERVTRNLQFINEKTHQELMEEGKLPPHDPSSMIFPSDILQILCGGRESVSDIAVQQLNELVSPEKKMPIPDFFRNHDTKTLANMLSNDKTLFPYNSIEDSLTQKLNFYLANKLLPTEFSSLRDTLLLFLLATERQEFQPDSTNGQLTPETILHNMNPWNPQSHSRSFPCNCSHSKRFDDQNSWIEHSKKIFQHHLYWFTDMKDPELLMFARCFCQTAQDAQDDRSSEFSLTEETVRKGAIDPKYVMGSPSVLFTDKAFFHTPKILELCHIFTSPQHQISRAIGYFNQHPEIISDPDYQRLLMQMVFGHRKGYARISKNEGDLLGHFLTENLKLALESKNNVSTAIFLIRMNRYLSLAENFNPIFLSLDKIQGILENKTMDPEIKSLAFAEYISALGALKEKNPQYQLSKDQLGLLLKGIAWIGLNPLAKNEANSRVIWEMEATRNLYFSDIKEHLTPEGKPNNDVLNAIRKSVVPTASDTIWDLVQGSSLLLKSNDDHSAYFDPVKGFFSDRSSFMTLPQQISSNRLFKKIFTGDYKAQFVEPDVYRITYQNEEYLVFDKKGSLECNKKYNDNWWQYSTSYKYINMEYKEWCLDNQTLWVNVETKEMLIFNQETGALEYTIPYSADDNKSDPLKRASDGLILGDQSLHLGDFEEKFRISEWYDPKTKKLAEVELPRFNLSFKPFESNPNDLYCTQLPGWKLDKNRNVSALGSCNYALALVNNKGERRILLPNQLFHSSGEKDVLASKVTRSQEATKKCAYNYFCFDLNEKGEFQLNHNSQAANLLLTKTLLAHRQYDEAARILYRFGKKLTAYTDEELEHLVQIASMEELNGDLSGNSRAIALYACFLALNNGGKDNYVKENPEKIAALFGKYLDLYRHITAIKLSKSEEISLIKDLKAFGCGDQVKFKRRLDELNLPMDSRRDQGEISQENSLRTTKQFRVYSIPKVLNNFKLGDYETTVDSSYNYFHKDFNFKEHLIPYIKKAIQGEPPQEVEWIDTASKCLLGSESIEAICLGHVFQEIFKNPQSFAMPPERKDRYSVTYLQERQRWWENLLRQVGEKRHVLARTPEESVDITPSGYCLDPNKIPQADTCIALETTMLKRQNLKDTLYFTENSGTPKESNVTMIRDTGFRSTQPCRRNSPVQHNITEWFKEKTNQQELEMGCVEKRELNRLKEDYTCLMQQNASPVYELTKEVHIIAEALSNEKINEKCLIEEYKKAILNMANRLPKEEFLHAQRSLELLGGTAKKIIMDDILSSLAQNNSKKIKELNPYLDEESVKDLYNLTADFLILSIRATQREKALVLCSEIQKTSDLDHRQEQIQELGGLLNAERTYDPCKRPAYLVFEFYAEISMRPDQVEKLDLFLKGEKTDLIMEMIMGSGKSKVLMPLLGLMRADGKKLSMLIVPPSLFSNIATDTQEALQKNFGQSLRSLDFDRESPITTRSLEKIKETLRAVIENRECLIMTSRSLESFVLKFMELYKLYEKVGCKSESGPSMQALIQSIAEILQIFKSQGLPLIDEADTVLNILHEVSFSTGGKEPPDSRHIATIGLFYDILYTDPYFKDLVSLESDPTPKGKEGLTESSYQEQIQKPLAKAFIEKLKESSIGSNTDKILKNYFRSLSENDQTLLIDYLCRNSENATITQDYFNTLDDKIREIFALAAEELCVLLPHTLPKITNVNYGLDNGTVAIPYAAVDTPTRNSLFANPFITMNFTYQSLFKQGISQAVIESYLKKLQRQVATEGAFDISQMEAWKTFLFLRGDLNIPLANFTPEELQKLVEEVNKKPLAKLHIIKNILLPQIEIYPGKISCSAIDLTSLFNSPITGFTGTLWNGSSFDKKLELLFSEGTDSKTIDLLWKNSQDKINILSSVGMDNILGQLKKYSAVIDVGGYLKEGGTAAIAQRLAKLHEKPVLYYNEHGIPELTNGQSIASVAPKDRVTLYDQSHTTGADIKQSDKAVGALTIGRSILLRDLLQGAWRLRGLEKHQTIEFLIDAEVAHIMRQSLNLDQATAINFSHILEFAIKNQSQRQGEDAFKTFTQQLESLNKNFLLNVLLEEKTDDKLKQKIFNLLNQSWFQETNKSCDALYGSIVLPKDSELVLDERLKQFFKALSAMQENLKDDLGQLPHLATQISQMYQQATEIHARAIENVHEEIVSTDSERNGTMELDVSTEASKQQEVQASQQSQTEIDVNSIQMDSAEEAMYFKTTGDLVKIERLDYKDAREKCYSKNTYVMPITQFVEQEIENSAYSEILSGILVSINACEIYVNKSNIEDVSCFGPTRVPFTHLRIEDSEVTILSTNDPGINYTIDVGFTEGDPLRVLLPDVIKKIVKIKVLNGSAFFSPNERPYLQEWINEVGTEAFVQLLKLVSFKNQRHKLAEYKGGTIHNLLKAACAFGEGTDC
ncbi:MAG: DUF3638 domain-containing protein [Parachlamydiaceae bacterium]